jgi:hypothetical protein
MAAGLLAVVMISSTIPPPALPHPAVLVAVAAERADRREKKQRLLCVGSGRQAGAHGSRPMHTMPSLTI